MLQAWRDKTGISQPEAAAKLRTPFASYRNWETGRTVPCGAVRAIIESVTADTK